MKPTLFFSLIFFFLVRNMQAQDLTGTWEGYMNGEKLQVNIMMKQRQICGYTTDYVLQNPSSYCKAYFRGSYDEKHGVWVLVGTSFIENSGDHILMVLKLSNKTVADKNTLEGTVESKSVAGAIFNLGSSDPVKLKRVSFSPAKLPNVVLNCFPVIKKSSVAVTPRKATVKVFLKKTDPVIVNKVHSKTLPVKPKNYAIKKIPAKITDNANLLKTDTAKIRNLPVSAIVKQDSQPELLQKMNARKNITFSHITVNEKNITLNVYDNGIVDNDTVSIFYNGKLIANRQRLSEKPLQIKLELDERAALHEIVMFAENLGTIAPNTALIVITSGNKRYELHSSASLTENAVLVFEYKPGESVNH